jgi:hypothetical protein
VVDPKVLTVTRDVQLKATNPLIHSRAARLDGASRLQLDIQASGKLPGLARQLEQLGVKVTEDVEEMRVIQAWVPADKVDDVAALSRVQAVRLPDSVHTHVTSAGDGIHQADKVRNQFAALGIDGTGVKVGVISNGVDHKNLVGAELPNVTVDPAHPGSGDEGTAMLEIVHDLAPGAQLYFAGIANSTQMIPSINYLVAQGCDVIIDDLGFYGESFFTDSAIAQHVAGVVANNDVVYVTSAGNSAGGNHYQAMYTQGNSFTADGKLHRFGGVGQDVNKITIPAGETFAAFLQWSDPWSGSNNNYDLFLYWNDDEHFQKLDDGVSVQTGQAGDRPFEYVQWTNNTGGAVHAELWIEKKNTAQARELEMFTISSNSLQFSTMGDSLIAQEAVPGAMVVAAANASNPSSVSFYSSRGGSSIYTNPGVNQAKSVRDSLDGTAIDGVQTKIGQLGYFSNPFYGTSAASPHAGAIAALVRQVNPTLTPAQVISTMTSTATDIETAGYDTTSGHGRFNALNAVYKAMTPGTPDLAAASDLGTSNSDNITNDNTPTFTGNAPAGSFVRLLIDGVEQASLQLAAAATSYSLTSPALGHGNHTASIRVAASASVPLANNSNTSAVLNVAIDMVAPTVVEKTFYWDNVAFQKLSWKFSEDISASVDQQDLVLMNTWTNTLVDTTSWIDGPDTAHFKFDQFTYGALPDGEYTATMVAAGVTDKAGNPLAANSVLDFFYLAGDANHDGAVNVNDLGILATNWQQSPRITSNGDFTYDGTVDVADLGILATNWQNGLYMAPAQQSAKSIFADDPQDMLELIA